MATRSRDVVWLAAALGATACMTDFAGYKLANGTGDGGHTLAGGGTSGSDTASGGDGTGARKLGGGGLQTTAGGGATSKAGAGGATSAAGAGGRTTAASGGSGTIRDGGITGESNPSCIGLAATCGPRNDTSCCAAARVPGGTYNRGGNATFPATVSDFVLDTFEITVGRFRQFAAAYSRTMTPAGSGKNPSNLADDPGWDPAWSQNLPVDATALSTSLLCHASFQTWTATPGAHETRPLTCLDWYEAYAFCIWDGGRLPTEAEWNYAAAGGNEQRKYPWGAVPPDDTYAVFCGAACAAAENVGTKSPKGDGRWGHSDLGGNAWEWNLDFYATPYPASVCADCAATSPTAGATTPPTRVFAGASYGNNGSYFLTSARYNRDPTDHNGYVGARCARSP